MLAALCTRLLIHVLGLLYPAYRAFKLTRGPGRGAPPPSGSASWPAWTPEDTVRHYTVMAAFGVVETVADYLLFWFPLFAELKLALVLWLVIPHTRGTLIVYAGVMEPWLLANENTIDAGIDAIKQSALETSARYGSAVLTSVKDALTSIVAKIFRLQIPSHERTQPTQPHPLPATSSNWWSETMQSILSSAVAHTTSISTGPSPPPGKPPTPNPRAARTTAVPSNGSTKQRRATDPKSKTAAFMASTLSPASDPVHAMTTRSRARSSTDAASPTSSLAGTATMAIASASTTFFALSDRDYDEALDSDYHPESPGKQYLLAGRGGYAPLGAGMTDSEYSPSSDDEMLG